MSEIERLKAEVTRLRVMLEKEIESHQKTAQALAFYANPMNYSLDDYRGVSGEMLTRCILYSDIEEINDISRIAGKLARARMSEMKSENCQCEN